MLELLIPTLARFKKKKRKEKNNWVISYKLEQSEESEERVGIMKQVLLSLLVIWGAQGGGVAFAAREESHFCTSRS